MVPYRNDDILQWSCLPLKCTLYLLAHNHRYILKMLLVPGVKWNNIGSVNLAGTFALCILNTCSANFNKTTSKLLANLDLVT